MRAAAELGTDKMLVTTGWGYMDDSAREGLLSLAEMAADYGMMLALEVLRRDD